jgi:uncharacterized protein
VLRLDSPLSFWGGTDADGRVIDTHHPQFGESLSGRVIVMRSGRGSSSSSSVLAEQLRRGTGPAAILLAEPDAIVALGVLVADELYGMQTPVVLLDPDAFLAIPQDGEVHVVASREDARVVMGTRSA